MGYALLRELVREKYNSDAAFGLKIGWVPQKVHKFLFGKYIPKLSEATRICRALDITLDYLASFFAE